MKIKLFLLLLVSSLVLPAKTWAQQDYRNFNTLTRDLSALANRHSANTDLKSLAKTPGGKDIWALTLYSGQAQDKPAVAIVGGVDGSHVLGVEMTARLAEKILMDHKDLLEKTTFYIFPNMSPDATEQYFNALKYERRGNGTNTDDDRDGDFGEDGFEDLNKDKRITMMRIEDPTGDYRMLEEDSRIMVKANPEKGEVGTHKLLTEGMDNDKDGHFNEDGEGGVVFNKNLSYNFPYFTPGAGEHPVSQKESRALLDFLYAQPNIYSILTFGPANNLTKPLKYNASGANKRVVTSILKGDAKLNELISETYNKIVSPKNAPASVTDGGGFFEWSYFHFGKLAMSTPGWWAPMPAKDTTQKETKNAALNFLRWADQNDVNDVFVDWTEVKHPDFPNQKVEVGGMVPFKQMNPPYAMVEEAVNKHSEFLAAFLEMQAAVRFENLKTESLGGGMSRITVDIHNPGLLPTHTEMGDRSRWMRQINVDLKVANNQRIVSGRGHQLINVIPQDGTVQLTWLVQGKGSVELTAGAPHVGTESIRIKL